MHRSASVAFAALLAVTTACGRERADFHVHGVAVLVMTDAPFTSRADLPARVEATVSAGLAYWGGSWSLLEGRRLVLAEGPYVACGGVAGAVGCYDGNFEISTTDPGTGALRCVEQTTLVHEIGHAVIGDALHQDARWMGFDSVAAELAGGVGYTPEGEADCPIAISLWRHPPERPPASAP